MLQSWEVSGALYLSTEIVQNRFLQTFVAVVGRVGVRLSWNTARAAPFAANKSDAAYRSFPFREY